MRVLFTKKKKIQNLKILKFGVKSVLATMNMSKATGLSSRYNQHFDIDNITEMINVI